jgi:ATP-dependent protease ClpP protease subunit
MKNVKELMLKRLENQVEENDVVEENENAVEVATEQIGEAELMQLIMEEVNSKTLTIHGEFNDAMVDKVKTFADQVWFYEADESRNLYVDIVSHGGSVCCLFAILDMLQTLKEEWGCNIVTRAFGYAESCGFALLCFGDRREMGKYSTLMCHQISYGINENLAGHQEELKRTKAIQKKLDKVITEKTGLTQNQLNKWYKSNKDIFIDYEEAIKLGIITVDEEEGDK